MQLRLKCNKDKEFVCVCLVLIQSGDNFMEKTTKTFYSLWSSSFSPLDVQLIHFFQRLLLSCMTAPALFSCFSAHSVRFFLCLPSVHVAVSQSGPLVVHLFLVKD